jgi:hypothetical protein
MVALATNLAENNFCREVGMWLVVMVFSLAWHSPLAGRVQLLGEMVAFTRASL